MENDPMSIAPVAVLRGFRRMMENSYGKSPIGKSRSPNVPSPLMIGDGRIFLSGGYQAGSMMLKLEENDGKITPKTLFRPEA